MTESGQETFITVDMEKVKRSKSYDLKVVLKNKSFVQNFTWGIDLIKEDSNETNQEEKKGDTE